MAREKSIWDEHEILMYLGIAGYFFAFMIGIVGMATLFSGSGSMLGGMCGVSLLILIGGGSVLMAIGLRGRRAQKELERIADLLRGYRRIEITRLARKLGVTEMEAEYTIAECLGRGLLEGYFDRREGEFFTKDALYQVMNIDSCPNCGAPPDELYLVGEEIECNYCGTVAMARARPMKQDDDEES